MPNRDTNRLLAGHTSRFSNAVKAYLTIAALLVFEAPSAFAQSERDTSGGKTSDSTVAIGTQFTDVQQAGQQGADISWIPIPDTDDRFYMGQEAQDGRWVLTANESFFPKLGLRATGQGRLPDINGLNKGESFTSITDWNDDDVAEWGVFALQPGKIKYRVWMSANDSSGKFQLRCGDSVSDFRTRATNDGPQLIADGELLLEHRGRQSITLRCLDESKGAALAAIDISGRPVQGGAVLRKRWRPAAAHTRFSSSKNPDAVRLWVMEMDAVPGDLQFYSPMTTPFGYYGPTWRADGTVNAGFNFSLWSFGRGKEAPPIEQHSHLIAVGDRSASFGGFDHEGTGVKVRNWEPLVGRQGQRQVLALRVEPGPVYDTYFSYFYAADEQRWYLFGAGNKYNRGKPLTSLWVGSFVEVPGRASVQRSGPYPRVMRYRGWCMDESGRWYSLDRMKRGNVDRASQLTHTNRGVTEDGWFYLQTGGWEFRKPATGDDVHAANLKSRQDVSFLGDRDLNVLMSMPSIIDASSVARVGNEVRGTFSVQHAGRNPQVTLYWGSEEALTFADRWEQSRVIDAVREGANEFTLPEFPSDQPLFLRARLDNDSGKFWSPETARSPR
ncbi:MAG: DUF3472 domain-containing protein [Rubripirellula sp.]